MGKVASQCSTFENICGHVWVRPWSSGFTLLLSGDDNNFHPLPDSVHDDELAERLDAECLLALGPTIRKGPKQLQEERKDVLRQIFDYMSLDASDTLPLSHHNEQG